jgi:anti-anti-sigma factor
VYVRLTGDLDLYSAAALRLQLAGIAGNATIDLSDVAYIGAAGLHELALVAKRVAPATIALRNPSKHILRILEIVRFTELFVISYAEPESPKRRGHSIIADRRPSFG